MPHPALKPVWDDLQRRGKQNVQILLETEALRFLLQGDSAAASRTVTEALQTLEQAKLARSSASLCSSCLAKDMETGYPPYEGSFLTGHGSEWMIMRDMLSAGIAIYDELPGMYRLAVGRFFKGILPARNFWYPGHAFHQRSAYAEMRVSSVLYPLWLFQWSTAALRR